MDPIMDDYLLNTLTYPVDLIQALTAQGVISFDTVASLNEEDITQVCRIVRRPGGTHAKNRCMRDNFYGILFC